MAGWDRPRRRDLLNRANAPADKLLQRLWVNPAKVGAA